jgi:hypothetical protein
MKPRHDAALALVGWYFLSAPLNAQKNMSDPSAPLNLWTNLAAFDTAEQCERFKVATMQGVRSEIRAKAEDNFLCIASDDPRLKTN